MITKEVALTLAHGQTLHYTGLRSCFRLVGPRGGIREFITHVRVSGRCQTWKTRPDEFRVPVKYGLYASGEVTNRNGANYHLASACPLLTEEAAS